MPEEPTTAEPLLETPEKMKMTAAWVDSVSALHNGGYESPGGSSTATSVSEPSSARLQQKVKELEQELAEEIQQRDTGVIQWEGERKEWEEERQEMMEEMAAEARERHRLLEVSNAERVKHKEERVKMLEQIESLMYTVNESENRIAQLERAGEKAKAAAAAEISLDPAQLKEDGNRLHKAGNYRAAVVAYTKALEFDADSCMLWSNRSASHLSLRQPELALEDARTAIACNIEWARGHYRVGCALQALQRHKEAAAAFDRCLELDPDPKQSEQAKLKQAKAVADGEQLRALHNHDLANSPSKQPQAARQPGGHPDAESSSTPVSAGTEGRASFATDVGDDDGMEDVPPEPHAQAAGSVRTSRATSSLSSASGGSSWRRAASNLSLSSTFSTTTHTGGRAAPSASMADEEMLERHKKRQERLKLRHAAALMLR